MELVYFPFSDIHPVMARVLGQCHRPVVLLYPAVSELPNDLNSLSDTGILNIRTSDLDAKQIRGRVKACREWLTGHARSDLAFMQALGTTDPVLTEPAISRLKSDIQSFNQPSVTPQTNDALLQAATFLQLAADFDRRQMEIDVELAQLAIREKKMFSDLNGIVSGSSSGAGIHDLSLIFRQIVDRDYGSKLTRLRLQAWSILLNHLPAGESIAMDSPVVFVTSSQAVFQTLQDRIPSLKVQDETFPVPLNVEPDNTSGQVSLRLKNWIHNLLAEETSPKADAPPDDPVATLTLAITRQMAPSTFFASLTNDNHAVSTNNADGCTLIAWLH